MADIETRRRTPVPRGLARTGPVILSYGFRPFFLAAGIWGLAAMALWIVAVTGVLEIGGSYGSVVWHGHEMLFGYTSAALAGFLLTSVPNWTGRLPVSGMPLLGLFLLWCAGRAALLGVDVMGLATAVAIDAAFMPVLLVVCAREIVAGRKWNNLKILGGLLALTLANIGYHGCILAGIGPDLPGRAAVAAYVTLIMIIGGRILPSFTRNWLNKRGEKRLPAPYGHVDTASMILAVAALVAWVALPEHQSTGILALAAALAQGVRLSRWRGWAARSEGLVFILHLAYGFVVLGLVAIAATAFGLLDAISSMHVLTVGGIGSMTLAVMSRATRGHTGLELRASLVTMVSYGCILVAGAVRPLASILPDAYMQVLTGTALAWMLAFLFYLAEYASALTRMRRDLPQPRSRA
ncbi:NnrS family protein [Devosia submarina]|uniref:NnrS family protein n=1 Tax=Devosia submarina TaxID=1173082 RepID=UPI000D39710A|nr:NnrS family protein [Devosia submarina]